MRALLLLFIIVPILEMWLLIEVGSRIGALPTIALVFLTGAIGLALLRQQGLSTLLRVDQRLAQGELPAAEVIEGVVLAVGGALLLTPGFITDVLGFACLLPPTRKLLVAGLLRHNSVSTRYGRSQNGGYTETEFTSYHSKRTKSFKKTTESHIIEGEYRRDD